MSGSISYSELFQVLKEGFKEISNLENNKMGSLLTKDAGFEYEKNIEKIIQARKAESAAKKISPVQTAPKYEEPSAEEYESLETFKKGADKTQRAEEEIQTPRLFTLDFNPDNVKMGFIYSEILGRPKCKRRRG